MAIHLKREHVKALEASGHIPAGRPKKIARPKATVKKIDSALFQAMCKAHGLPPGIPEYQFMPGRKWAFDWMFQCPDQFLGGRRRGWLYERVGLEIQGALFTEGRHTRGAALLEEYEKLNTAQILGYKIILVTPDQVETGEAFTLVKRALFEE